MERNGNVVVQCSSGSRQNVRPEKASAVAFSSNCKSRVRLSPFTDRSLASRVLGCCVFTSAGGYLSSTEFHGRQLLFCGAMATKKGHAVVLIAGQLEILVNVANNEKKNLPLYLPKLELLQTPSRIIRRFTV